MSETELKPCPFCGGEWQPIETAPTDGTQFLMYVPAYEYPIVTGWGQNVDLRPTHWQPLPDVPKGSYHDPR